MQPKQLHYVRCPVLGLLCNSLCGPRTKNLEILLESLCVQARLYISGLNNSDPQQQKLLDANTLWD